MDGQIQQTFIPGLVSVIIPTHNRANLLAQTLDSVWGQSYRPIELLIIDNDSNDDTKQVVVEWKKKHSDGPQFRVCYFWHQNQGAATARNFGLIKSRGEFIQFLDSDDLLHPDKIMHQVKYSLEKSVTVFGDSLRFSVGKKFISIYPAIVRSRPNFALKDWFEGRFVLPCSFLWKRKDILQNGLWNEKMTTDDDGEFACRFLINGGRWEFCPNSWSYYRIYTDFRPTLSQDSSGAGLEAKLEVLGEMEKKLEETDQLNSLRSSLACYYWDLAKRAVFCPKIRKKALLCFRRLNPKGHIPEPWPGRILFIILGIPVRKRIILFLRRFLRVQPFRTIGKVKSIKELYVQIIK